MKRCNVERPDTFEVVKKEVKILNTFKGPYVVELLADEVITVRGAPEACLLLEYCPGGHLLDKLKTRAGRHLPAANIYKIFGQILLSLKPFHDNSPPVTHRDLKLENILFGGVSVIA